MKQRSLGILGCGFLGRVLFRQAREQGIPCTGTVTGNHVKNHESLRELSEGGEVLTLELQAEDLALSDADLEEKYISIRSFLDNEDFVLSIPPRRHLENVENRYPDELRVFLRLLDLHLNSLPKNLEPKKILLISSTSVYGAGGHAKDGHFLEVLETSWCRPETPSAKALCHAEEMLLGNWSEGRGGRERPKIGLSILRLGGIVGAGRHPRSFHRKGASSIFPLKTLNSTPTNLIHVEDAAAICLEFFRHPHFPHHEIFNGVCDSHPTRTELYGPGLKEGESPPSSPDTKNALSPKKEPPPEKEFPPKVRGKIVLNQKLKTRFNYEFKYNDMLSWANKRVAK